MLIAEELLLVLTDATTGRFVVGGSSLDLALAGAAVIELAELGRIEVAGRGERVKEGRVVVRDQTSTGDALLDEVLATCVEREGAAPQDVLGQLSSGIGQALLDRLVERGILRQEKDRILGVFPVTRWPAVDSAHERDLLERLRGILVHGATPDRRSEALIALLSVVGAAHKVVPAEDAKAVERRAKEIREGEWAADAVGKAVEAVQAAVTTAIFAASTAATTGAQQ